MRLLVISHVLPFPGDSGQQLRVRHTLEAAVREFHVDYLTFAPAGHLEGVRKRLAAFGCRPIVLESCVSQSRIKRLTRSLASGLFVLRTGMKSSNYTIGKLELSEARVLSAIDPQDYNAVLYEYFHAVGSVGVFRKVEVPAVLDMHNVLWKSHEQRLSEQTALPAWFKRLSVRRYRQQEESAWDRFDALVTINRREHDLVEARQPAHQKLFYSPMGTDLSRWPCRWQPVTPRRLGYYGGLGSAHNEAAALQCHDQVMPQIWRRFPDAELWLVGSNPSPRLRDLTADARVKVTGFVEKIQEILSTMSLVLCPWSGTYGFRSRIVEVMALGVPVVATPAAVDGMELESGRGIRLVHSLDAMAAEALEWLGSPGQLHEQSRLARSEMERLYSLENTYGRLIRELLGWIGERQRCSSAATVS